VSARVGSGVEARGPACEQDEHARANVRRGFVWLGAASLAARLIEVAKVMVVLWFLTPEQVGQATLAWSVSVVLEALSGLGLGAALLQTRALCARTLASAFWYTQAVASLIVFSVWVSAAAATRAYGHAELAPMLMVAVTKLWFVGYALLPLTLLNRALAYERIACISTLASLSSGLTTCLLAWLGLGAWAPLLGNLTGGLATAVFAGCFQRYRPSLCFDWQRLAPHARFGVKLAGAGVVQQLVRNVDYLLVGRFLDATAVGVYRVAFDLAMAPCLALSQVTGRAAVPVYANLRGKPALLARTFLWTLESLGLGLAPLCFAVAAHGDTLLLLIRHGIWTDAAGALPWLCAAAFVRCMAQAFPALFQTLERPVLALYEALCTAALLTGCIAAALYTFSGTHGLVAAAWGWFAACPLQLLVLFAMMRRLLPVTARALLHSQRHTLGILSALTACALITHGTLRALNVAQSTPLVALIELLGYALYVRFVAKVGTRSSLGGEERARHPLALSVG
jgi:O-antigen/teichoic acid export membrane protein